MMINLVIFIKNLSLKTSQITQARETSRKVNLELESLDWRKETKDVLDKRLTIFYLRV